MADQDPADAPDETTTAAPRSPDDTPTLQRAPHGSGDAMLAPGATIAGRYRIVSLVGRGGMGSVYRADDLVLGQAVALKFISGRASPGALELLTDEVRIGRRITHPNVCRLHDIVEKQGQRFLVMEFVDGEDLSSLLRRLGSLPHETALAIARDVAAGLAAAHAEGVVHRDLKPANVMIDGRGRARITDFGLAIATAEASARHEIAGTPAYMAPEQMRGGAVDARADIYALGASVAGTGAGLAAISVKERPSLSLRPVSSSHRWRGSPSDPGSSPWRASLPTCWRRVPGK